MDIVEEIFCSVHKTMERIESNDGYMVFQLINQEIDSLPLTTKEKISLKRDMYSHLVIID